MHSRLLSCASAVLVLATTGLASPQLGSRPADEWVKTLDGETRVAALKIDDIVTAMNLKSGETVADIGAGTGLFDVPMGTAVAPNGRVYAVEIDQAFFPMIRKRAVDAHVGNVQTVLGQFTDPALPAKNVDVALFHDVMHHIDKRADYIKTLAPYLAPSGRIVVVDYEPGKGPHREQPQLEVSRAQLASWMQAAGFAQAEDIPLFTDKYVLVFRRSPSAPYQPTWESLDSRPVPSWYLDAKFGIFIHWGVYSVPSFADPHEYAEWYWHTLRADPGNSARNRQNHEQTVDFHNRAFGPTFSYYQFAPMFRAELFDPDEWAAIIKQSGAKYVALTSKHHDGFCLFQSGEANRDWGQPWNAVDIGPRRDLLGDLSAAVRRAGLKMGFYYSLYEWFNPLWLNDRRLFVEKHMMPQFKDVVTRYKPSIIFGDGEWDMTSAEWRTPELLAWLYNESSVKDEVIVNDRWGKDTRHKHGGYYTTEYGAGLPDAAHPWEENRGMGFSYGYNRNEPLGNYRTGQELVWMFVDTVSRGGNLLLNIGPRADGKIPEIMQQRLKEMGDWLAVNGEAIYGTRAWTRTAQWSDGAKPEQRFGEFRVKYDILELAGQQPRDGHAVKQVFFTKKPDALYAITPGWPGATLTLKDVKAAPDTAVTLLGVKGALKWKQQGANLTIDTPRLSVDELPCKYAYAFKITGVIDRGASAPRSKLSRTQR